jgi:hypothetical protein
VKVSVAFADTVIFAQKQNLKGAYFLACSSFVNKDESLGSMPGARPNREPDEAFCPANDDRGLRFIRFVYRLGFFFPLRR